MINSLMFTMSKDPEGYDLVKGLVDTLHERRKELEARREQMIEDLRALDEAATREASQLWRETIEALDLGGTEGREPEDSWSVCADYTDHGVVFIEEREPEPEEESMMEKIMRGMAENQDSCH